MITSLRTLFSRDLDRLLTEVSTFKKSENLWKAPGGITNSAGNLAMHICGNLQHFVGGILGDSGYIRDRDSEFTLTGVARSQILEEIQKTEIAVIGTLDHLADEELDKIYPEDVIERNMRTRLFLIHLYGHLNYHLGQINYLRRVLEG